MAKGTASLLTATKATKKLGLHEHLVLANIWSGFPQYILIPRTS